MNGHTVLGVMSSSSPEVLLLICLSLEENGVPGFFIFSASENCCLVIAAELEAKPTVLLCAFS